MRYTIYTVALVIILAGWSRAGYAHGARCTIIEGGVSIEATYHEGSPMVHCDVEIVRPGSEDPAVYLVGTTDPGGRFAFVPDTSGKWIVTVDDGMGHRVRTEILVDSDMLWAGGRGGMGRIRGGIVGLGIIFGLFGLAALFYCRRTRGGVEHARG